MHGLEISTIPILTASRYSVASVDRWLTEHPQVLAEYASLGGLLAIYDDCGEGETVERTDGDGSNISRRLLLLGEDDPSAWDGTYEYVGDDPSEVAFARSALKINERGYGYYSPSDGEWIDQERADGAWLDTHPDRVKTELLEVVGPDGDVLAVVTAKEVGGEYRIPEVLA